ncbi:MAG: DUF2182 domain-containing protein [Pseudolabrys sp.]
MTMASSAMGLRASLFLASWVVMMVAMMFPTAAPMILTFHRVQAVKYKLDDALVSTWVFVGAYLLVWAFAGIAAYAGVLVVETAAARAALTPAAEAQVGGAIIMIAGIYQLTPLKELCLSQCRTPIRFIMTSWRDGTAGAFRMGLLHGFYCLGCCWLLFVILFPLGMNVGAMAAVTLIILAEKMLPWPRLMPHASRRGCRACALRCAGDCVIATPPHLQAKWQRGHARRIADEDAREWQRTSHKVTGHTQLLQRCTLLALSGHRLVRCTCPLLTQSRHWYEQSAHCYKQGPSPNGVRSHFYFIRDSPAAIR